MTDWRWWPAGHQVVQILGEYELFGKHTVDIYGPADGRVQTLEAEALAPLHTRRWTPEEAFSRVLALRALSLAAAGDPVAPGTNVELLPHQVAILHRALRLSPVRLAICCEVGLGKTTTAGAVVSELLARGRIGRVLVVAPKGVQLQWVAEMREKFGLDFVRIGPEGIPIDSSADIWRAFSLVVTSVDAVKPLRRRAGWSLAQLDDYNELRVGAVANAGWDLVIIDEAHHVAGSSADVARHQLALDLSEGSTHLLLLTATPHSGKSDSFRRFLGLIDPAFRQGLEISAATVASAVARSDKSTAVDHAGHPLFLPRTTWLEIVPWQGHPLHRALYEEVTHYVRRGYLQARASGDGATGFLMLLFQRLVASSTAAVLAALERRRTALQETKTPAEEPALWDELEAEESELLGTFPAESGANAQDLDHLIDLAGRTLSAETDPKTVHFLGILRRLQREESDPFVKVLVFTQFRATQRMIVTLLESQGVTTATVDGTMGLADRASAQAAFRADAQVLVSTDAGGEGVNLQFAHVVVNWDLPWTPTSLEQRVGRLHRIGQASPVKAYNFALEDSVDQRVLEVLEAKLELILAELGVDKRGDVLATADSLTESLYVAAILDPTSIAEAGDTFASQAKAELEQSKDARQLLHDVTVSAPRLPRSQLPEVLHRLERVAGAAASIQLRSSSIVAPEEPVPTLTRGSVPGWLAVGRLTGGGSERLAGALAVFLPDQGRPDAMKGSELLTALTDGDASALQTRRCGQLPISVHDALRSCLLDYSYQALLELGAGEVPQAPAVRLAFVARIQP